MMILKILFRNAFHNKLRSGLTILGIAVAGFVLAIAGFIFPVGVLWWVGLGLSWPGYAQAVREQLPSGLALAGLIINAVMTGLSVVFLLVLIAVVAFS